MLLGLKRSLTYGPVRSRRLGLSLGINVFPGTRKVCTFECVYCQYGWATPIDASALDGVTVPTAEEVLSHLEDLLPGIEPAPAYLTFSGNGEPTLHPEFPAIASGVVALRDRLLPGARTAILSNSTMVDRPAVRAAIARLDVRIMKLDAGSEAVFRRYNRPAAGVTLAGVVEGLKQVPAITVQSLFAGGEGGNLAPAHVAAWVRAVAALRPLSVQLYTLARDVPARNLEPAPRRRLEAIQRMLHGEGIAAEVF